MTMGTMKIQAGVTNVEREGPFAVTATVEDLSAEMTLTPDGDEEFTCTYCSEQVWEAGTTDGEDIVHNERGQDECLDHPVTDENGQPVEDEDGNYTYGPHVIERHPLGWLEEVHTQTSTERDSVEVCVTSRDHNGHLKITVSVDDKGDLQVRATGEHGMQVFSPLDLGARFRAGNPKASTSGQ